MKLYAGEARLPVLDPGAVGPWRPSSGHTPATTVPGKNSLLPDSDGSGEHWGIVASLTEVAKLNGVGPFASLQNVLETFVAGFPANRLDELLELDGPRRWLITAGDKPLLTQRKRMKRIKRPHGELQPKRVKNLSNNYAGFQLPKNSSKITSNRCDSAKRVGHLARHACISFMAKAIVAAALIAGIPFAAASAQSAACRPEAAPTVAGRQPQQAGVAQAPPEQVEIWLDGSASMRGFITRAAGRRHGDYPLVTIVDMLPNLFTDYGVAIGLHRFGSAREPNIGLATFRRASTPAFYAGRYNDGSAPWLPLGDALDRDGVTIIVSDLFLDDRNVDGGGNGVVGDMSTMAGPISKIIRRGWSVNLVGIASRFSGTVYDLPGQPNLALRDGWMPLYIMIVGPHDQVAWTTRVLTEDILNRLEISLPRDIGGEAVHIARFGHTADVGVVTTAEILGQPGAVRFPDPPAGLSHGNAIGHWLEDVLRVSVDPRARRGGADPLLVSVDVPVAAPEGSNAAVTLGTHQVQAWSLAGGATVSGCGPNTRWVDADGAPIVAAVRSDGNRIDFSLFPPRAPLRTTYRSGDLIMVRIVVPQAAVTTTNTSGNWMSRWSFASSGAGEARANADRLEGFMPTLNLADLYRTLQRNTPPAGNPGRPVAFLDVVFTLSTD